MHFVGYSEKAITNYFLNINDLILVVHIIINICIIMACIRIINFQWYRKQNNNVGALVVSACRVTKTELQVIWTVSTNQ